MKDKGYLRPEEALQELAEVLGVEREGDGTVAAWSAHYRRIISRVGALVEQTERAHSLAAELVEVIEQAKGGPR